MKDFGILIRGDRPGKSLLGIREVEDRISGELRENSVIYLEELLKRCVYLRNIEVHSWICEECRLFLRFVIRGIRES